MADLLDLGTTPSRDGRLEKIGTMASQAQYHADGPGTVNLAPVHANALRTFFAMASPLM
jgi:hypothetical protein